MDRVAWYTKNSGNKTHDVGARAPNGLGVYDMSGNVWECVRTDGRTNTRPVLSEIPRVLPAAPAAIWAFAS